MKNTAIDSNDDTPKSKSVSGSTVNDKKQNELRQIAIRLAQLPDSKKGVFRQALKARGINPWKLPITSVNNEQQQKQPLSFAQQRLWLLDQIEGKDGHTVISNALTLEGHLDKAAVKIAFTTILKRHESLRTCFNIDVAGQAHQLIQGVDDFIITEHDLSQLSGKPQELALQNSLTDAKSAAFDLERDLMLRVNLVEINEHNHVLQFVTHHIASDGWSLAILMREFAALYNAHVKGHDALLSTLPISYADYAHWQRDWLQGEELDEQLNYWRQQLTGLPVVHDLPLDNARPTTQTFAGAKWRSELSDTTSQRLRDYCQASQSTLFMGLHAVFSVLLARYSGQDDIVVGSPVANREQQEVTSLIGFFVNLLVLRSDVSDDPDFEALLQRSKECLLDAYTHQQVPFEEIVEDLKPARSLSHSPLFQVLLVLQNNDNADGVELEGLAIQGLPQNSDTSHYDLSLYVFERENRLVLSWEYNTDLFRQSTIGRMANHFENLVTSLLDAPKSRISSAAMMEASEQQKITRDWNTTSHTFGSTAAANTDNIEYISIERLFSQQSAQNSNRVAAQFNDQHLSYAELETKSNQLAHRLQAQGVGPNDLVGIVQKRSLSLLVSLLGVMKAGAVYVPIDPNYPQDRVHYMFEHSGLSLLLTDQAVIDAGLLPAQTEKTAYSLINIDQHNAFDAYSRELPLSTAKQDDLAYVIYTSGSTGKPKGVQISRGNLTNFILSMQQLLKPNAEDSLLAVTSLSFDITALELYLPLVCGAKVIIADEELSMDGERLKSTITANNVSLMQATPVTWKLLLSADWSHCSTNNGQDKPFTALCGGEAFPLELAHTLLEQPISIWNLYGPTETTVWSAAYKLSNQAELTGNTVPIGQPIANTQLYVLDSALNPVSIGVTGELYIAGAGVARGYINNPELTAEQFIESNEYGRLYKTGDLARYRDSGILECLGRIDTQVKVRGYRIELGEVEHCLLQHDHVVDAVVNPLTITGEAILAAYVVLDSTVLDDSALSLHNNNNRDDKTQSSILDNIKEQVASQLPAYMVPSSIIALDALPLTPNGKVDRKALPASIESPQQHNYVAPSSELEYTVVNVWQDVLKIDRIGLDDNFFTLGGHSLLVIRVIALLQSHGINANVKQIFEKPKLRDFTASLNNGDNSAPIFRAAKRKIPVDCERVTPEMLPLVSLAQTEIDLIAQTVSGGMANILDIYPLGPLQQGIHFHHLMSQDSDPYVFPNLLKVENTAKLETLLAGLQFVIDRHDALRSVVISDGLSQPVQVVCRQATLTVDWRSFELSDADNSNLETPNDETSQDLLTKMQRLCEPRHQWMDITQAPLLRVQLAKEANSDEHYVLLQYHHLVSDHQGLAIIKRELAAFFSQQTDNLPIATPYREFVAHAQHQLENNDASAFFTQMLSDIEQPSLPFGLTNTQGDGEQIVDRRQAVPDDIAQKLRKTAKKTQVNPASIFHAAWAMVVAACSNQPKVVFGSVLSGRLQGTVGAEHMMGVFINTLPIRVDIDNRSVLDYVQGVNVSLTKLLSFEQTPLVLAQNCSAVPSEQPLFSALMNYRHSNHTDQLNTGEGLSGIEFLNIEVRNNYPITMSVDDYGGHDYKGDKGFNLAGLFDESVDADQLLGYMQNALALIVDALDSNNTTKAVNQLSVLSEKDHISLISNHFNRDEKASDLKELNSNDTSVSLIIHSFEGQAKRQPSATALITQQQTLTYERLNQQANQLAHFLVDQGVVADIPVALYMQRGSSLIVAILAVLKAGGCYLPLDTQWPTQRINKILDDAKPRMLLSEKQWQVQVDHIHSNQTLNSIGVRDLDTHYLDKAESEWSSHPKSNVLTAIKPESAAYIIYTSGSTGDAKGVVIEHQQLSQYCRGINQRLNIEGMSFAHISTVAADLGNTGLFGALCFGGFLNLIDADTAASPDEVAETLHANPVDAMKIVPTHLQGLLAAEHPRHLLPKKLLILGGEACPTNLLERVWSLSPSLRIVNHYGPSETTIGALTHELSPLDIDKNIIPIGKALPNTQLYILNRQQQLCPEGVEGELYIGGGHVSRGYLNRPELSQQSFINNPFSQFIETLSSNTVTNTTSSNARLYKTGDRVKRLPNGELVFLGRMDQQVKVRGYRVELGDITNALLAKLEISNAVVMLQETSVNPRLIAWVVADSNSDIRSDIITQLQQELPSYMVPQDIFVLDSLPVTVNGKFDKSALFQIAEQGSTTSATVSDKPRNEAEERLLAIWCDVLKLESIGINADFFELGGDSILSLQVIARAKKAGLKITPKLIFTQPTIAGLAEHAKVIGENGTTENGTASKTSNISNKANAVGHVSLTPIQRWFFESKHPDAHHWNQSMMFELAAAFDFNALQSASRALVNHHDALRMRFDHPQEQNPNPKEGLEKNHDKDKWSQRYAPVSAVNVTGQSDHISDSSFCQKINAVDLGLTALDDNASISRAIERKANELQTSLDLTKGPLIKVVYFSMSEFSDQTDRLMLIIHHLVIDGVSWRILLNDLYELYQQSVLQQPLNVGNKTASFKQWASFLEQYSQSEQSNDEVAYWRDNALDNQDHNSRLLNDHLLNLNLASNVVETQNSITSTLSLEQTTMLLQDAPAAYGTQINDLLLSALASTLCEVGESVLIELEGHGREQLSNEIDLSQTVGWFTSRFPVRLTHLTDLGPGSRHEHNNKAPLINGVMGQLRAIPNKGVGYGVIRYLHPDQAVRNEFTLHKKPLLSFNYLGQFDASLGKASDDAWSIAKERCGNNRSLNSQRNHAVDLIGRVVNGCLSMTWQHSTTLHSEDFITRLADRYQTALSDLIKHCLSVKSKVSQTSVVNVDNNGSSQQGSNSQLQLLRPTNSKSEVTQATPLFCFHHRGGHTREYKGLVKKIGADVPIYGIQSRVLSDSDCNDYHMPVVAQQYADIIQSVQVNGPYRLLGWSLGGVLAMAITQVLETRGQTVSFLGLIDSALADQGGNNDDSISGSRSQDTSLLESLFDVFGATPTQRYQSLSPNIKSKFEQELNQLNESSSERRAVAFACDWIVKTGLLDSDVIDADYLRLRYQTTLQSRRLIRSYTPNQVNAKIFIWWAENSLINKKPPTDWQQHCANISQQKHYEGGHFDIVQNTSLADELAVYITAEN